MSKQSNKKANAQVNVQSGKPRLPKIFVLDTNIILHDSRSIYNFQENDLVIPIAVIEELDKFKKSTDVLGYNAREFMRKIDILSADKNFFKGEGFSLGKGLGTLRVEINHPFPLELQGSFKDDIQDHRILAVAIWVKNQNPQRFVALVTKDVNLRMKARALGMVAQDYLTDRIEEKHIEKNEKRVQVINNLPKNTIERVASGGITVDEVRYKKQPANQLYKFRYEVQSGADQKDNAKRRQAYEYLLARFDAPTNSIVPVKPCTAYGIQPRNSEQVFAMDALMNPQVQLISLTGTAGTGKTLLALAAALEQADNFSQILLARPVIPLKNQEIGYLPGDAKDKIGPYMLPLYDNLAVIKKQFGISSKENVKIEDMLRREKLLISPLAYIRGRSLSNVFFIIDEAQNLTPHEVKTIITRAGEGTKIVFTGDIQQIDQPYLDKWSNGLTHINEKLYGEPLFEHVNLTKGERSKLSELAGKKL
ncbi:PhoH family protein [bacterium]|nr:PhoH family protein [bacterium]